MHETPLMREIQYAIGISGKYTCKRNNVGFAKREKVRYGLGNGSSDLLVLEHGTGRAIFLEIKTPIGELDDEQRIFIEFMNNIGVVSGVARSVDEAWKIIRSTPAEALALLPSTESEMASARAANRRARRQASTRPRKTARKRPPAM